MVKQIENTATASGDKPKVDGIADRDLTKQVIFSFNLVIIKGCREVDMENEL